MNKKNKKYLRSQLRRVGKSIKNKSEGTELFDRQYPGILDLFTDEIYATHGLLRPPYQFSNLYTIYEQSDILQECIGAMCQNVDGFGYQLQFLGDDAVERENKETLLQLKKAENFFDYANDEQSWSSIRKLMRKDYEILGNGALEVIRNRKKEMALVYYIPFKTLRITKVDAKPIIVKIKIKRNGAEIEIDVKKYFRRFAQFRDSTGQALRWFKSFGDPRILDAETGEYVTNENGELLEGKKLPKMEASEIMHFKNDFGGETYGYPRWIGVILDAIGRRQAQYVNYDLFDNQGIPPMAVMVSGGTLTDESVEELEALVRGMRGAEAWNKVVLLESNLEATGLEEKGSAKIELKNLTEYRKDDQMFQQYLETSEKAIRRAYRIPPLYTGGTEAYTNATSISSRQTTEEQVFVPERKEFDEWVNNKIMINELKINLWEYVTKGPRIVGSDAISKGVESFNRVGAFTINHAIEMANDAFGLQMSKFSEKWADYPVPIVLKMLELGMLGNLEAIGKKDVIISPQTEQVAKSNTQKMEATQKILDSDIFTEEEKALYKQLMTIQHAIVSRGE